MFSAVPSSWPTSSARLAGRIAAWPELDARGRLYMVLGISARHLWETPQDGFSSARPIEDILRWGILQQHCHRGLVHHRTPLGRSRPGVVLHGQRSPSSNTPALWYWSDARPCRIRGSCGRYTAFSRSGLDGFIFFLARHYWTPSQCLADRAVAWNFAAQVGSCPYTRILAVIRDIGAVGRASLRIASRCSD